MPPLLAHDHSKLDEMLEQVFDALERGDRRQTFLNLDHFWARLAMHIRAEHLHLFPILLQKARDPNVLEGTSYIASRLPDDISTLRCDHNFFVKEIGKDVNRLRGGEKEGGENVDLGEIRESLTMVAERLATHNELEEKDVYPLAQALLTAEELAELEVSFSRELANIPPRFAISNLEIRTASRPQQQAPGRKHRFL